MFRFDGNTWHEQSNFLWGVFFEAIIGDLAVDADGTTIAVSTLSWWSGWVDVYRFENNSLYRQAALNSPNLDGSDGFGKGLALSADGESLYVGAVEDYWDGPGTVYLLRADGLNWNVHASIHASNGGRTDWFGSSVALSADGETLAVGADSEDSSATGVNGDQSDDSAYRSGAVYVY